MPSCKLCGLDRKLIRAHVLPRFCFADALKEEGYVIEVTNATDRYNRKLPVGIYDRELVCEPCERLFSPWDSYGKFFLFDRDFSGEKRADCQRGSALIISEYDYTKLKLFFLATLWRAAASSQAFFAATDLGPHLGSLGHLVRNRDPGDSQQFPVLLSRFDGPSDRYPDLDPKHACLNPQRAKFLDVNCVKLYVADFIAWIKVDSRPFREPYSSFCLAPSTPLNLFLRDFGRSKELRAMWQITQQSKH